jgi:hypothetical protein
MITENAIKTTFIVNELRRQTDLMYKRLLERFRDKLQSRTGSTEKSLSAPNYTITASDENFQVIAYVTKQLRFQDLGVRKLYTRPMHAMLRQNVRENLQYGLSEEIREKIINQLSTLES